MVVLPGETLKVDSTSQLPLLLGPGLLNQDGILVSRAGTLQRISDRKVEKVWVQGRKRGFTPSPSEPVIGIILSRQGEAYKVDIGAAQPARLDELAFENASKRNRPNLKNGDLVYAMVMNSPQFAETELTCVDPATSKASGYGLLKDGFLIRKLPLERCSELLNPNSKVLTGLATQVPFEVAIGMNGRVWINLAPENEEKMPEAIRIIKGEV